MGGWHSTEVMFALLTQLLRVRITAQQKYGLVSGQRLRLIPSRSDRAKVGTAKKRLQLKIATH